jgi:hypothetical protein
MTLNGYRNSSMQPSLIKLFNGLEYLYPENNTIGQIKRVLAANTDILLPLADAFSIGQIKSKQWVASEVQRLEIKMGTVFLCAGWYATLAQLLLPNPTIDKFYSFDIDPSCCSIAEIINKQHLIEHWKFKASTIDIRELGYDNFQFTTTRSNGTTVVLTATADTIINTSCEHIPYFDQWYSKIPSGKLLIVQSNNYVDVPEHVNCVTSLVEFAQQTPMSMVFYEGILPLDKYDRYMRIGIK